MVPDSVKKKIIRHYYYACVNPDCPARPLLRAGKSVRKRIGIDADMLDDAIKVLLRQTTEDDTEIMRLVRHVNKVRDTGLPELESSKNAQNHQIEKLEQDLKEQLSKREILHLSEVAQREVERIIEGYSTQISQLRESVSDLTRRVALAKSHRVSKTDVIAFMRNIKIGLDAGSKKQRRDLVTTVFKDVRVGLDSEEIEAHLYTNPFIWATRKPTNWSWFELRDAWYTKLRSSRTTAGSTYALVIGRPDIPLRKTPEKTYRNPVIYARELHEEMVRDNLTRRLLAERHGISSDRITQWLCLLKLPEEKLQEIEALGDNWDRKVVTERELRERRQSQRSSEGNGLAELD